MWTCKKCGEKHEDVFDSCWKCGPEIAANVPPPEAETTSGHSEQDSFYFACVVCGRQLRIALPINTGRYCCPACKARYQSVKASNEPFVFILVPEAERKAREDAPIPPKRRRPVPKEVKAALALLGLTDHATFEEAKQAYRKSIQEYHHDKVAHLGPDLKKVAEQKTKEIVAAFDSIKRFFAENEP